MARLETRRQFLSDLERRAARRGLTTEVHQERHSPNYSLYLVSESLVARIPFVLATQQEISPLMFRSMLTIIGNYLRRDSLTRAQQKFGEEARELVQEIAEAARQAAGDADQAVPRPAEPLPRKGRDAQRAWYFAHVDCLTPAKLRARGIVADGDTHAVLALEHGGETYFPTFQFDKGKPREVVADVLAIFGERRSVWQVAFWFISANSWLDGKAPADRLSDRAVVAAAAAHDVNALIA